MGFFNWITEGTRRAIVRGIEQAAAELNESGSDAEITIRLPAHHEPLRLPHEQPAASGNGKRKSVASAASRV